MVNDEDPTVLNVNANGAPQDNPIPFGPFIVVLSIPNVVADILDDIDK